MRKFFACLLLISLFSISSATAKAATVEFAFSSFVGGLGTTIPGAFNGQTFDLSIFANNGSATTVSQSWGISDFLSAVVTIGGGAYSMTIDPDASTIFSATTDGGGNVTGILLSDSSGNADSLGSTIMFIAVNGGANIILADSNIADAVDSTIPDNFTVSVVPLPASFSLYGAGLALLGLISWRRRKAKTCFSFNAAVKTD